MKLQTNISAVRRQSGVTLIECLVYVSVFAILLGIGTVSFYFCWDHTQATIVATKDVGAALQAGECWRADVRAATGKITVETSEAGETIRIPGDGKQILYRFENGELRRDVPAQNISRVLLEKVKASEMKTEARASVTAWRWDLEVAPRRHGTHIPLLFTFEAAQTKP